MPTPEPIRWGFATCAICQQTFCEHRDMDADVQRDLARGELEQADRLKRLEAKLSDAVDTFMAAWMEWKAAREGMRHE